MNANNSQSTAAASSPLTPYFLEKLQEQRHADAVSGSLWSQVWNFSAAQAAAVGHIDRGTAGLQTVLALLQASETCRRRRPEDFGVGDDRHEGLLHAARELADGLRTHIDFLDARGPGVG